MARIFISHSHRDQAVAERLVDLLMAAFRFQHTDILSTSVDGHKLQGGADISLKVLDEIDGCSLVLGILSHDSIVSTYVAYEYGVAQHAEKTIIPIRVRGCPANVVAPLLPGTVSFDATSRGDLHSLLERIAHELSLTLAPGSAYSRHLEALVVMPAAVSEPDLPSAPPGREIQPEASVSEESKRILSLFLEIEEGGDKWLETRDVATKLQLSFPAAHRECAALLELGLLFRGGRTGRYRLTVRGRDTGLSLVAKSS